LFLLESMPLFPDCASLSSKEAFLSAQSKDLGCSFFSKKVVVTTKVHSEHMILAYLFRLRKIFCKLILLYQECRRENESYNENVEGRTKFSAKTIVSCTIVLADGASHDK
jgi:hypothetical protein